MSFGASWVPPAGWRWSLQLCTPPAPGPPGPVSAFSAMRRTFGKDSRDGVRRNSLERGSSSHAGWRPSSQSRGPSSAHTDVHAAAPRSHHPNPEPRPSHHFCSSSFQNWAQRLPSGRTAELNTLKPTQKTSVCVRRRRNNLIT